jgi:hypothetical protein
LAYFLEVPLDDGQVVLVEVTRQVDDVAPAGRVQDVVGRLPEAFTSGLDRVQALAAEALRRMRAFPEPPDSVSVEFGLKLTAKAGVVVAESTGVAHMKLIAEWHRREGGAGAADQSGRAVPRPREVQTTTTTLSRARLSGSSIGRESLSGSAC